MNRKENAPSSSFFWFDCDPFLGMVMVTLGCALQGGERTSRHGLHVTCGILSSQRGSHSHDQSPPRINKVSHNP